MEILSSNNQSSPQSHSVTAVQSMSSSPVTLQASANHPVSTSEIPGIAAFDITVPQPNSIRINVEGAFIVDEDESNGRSTPPGTRDIALPHHNADVSHIAVDIGGSLAKIVYFTKDANGKGGRLNFTKFETERIDEYMQFIAGLCGNTSDSDKSNTHAAPKNKLHIMATGGGSYKFYDRIRQQLGVEVTREDEMECLIAGLDFFINEIPQEVFCYSEQDPMRFAEARPNIYPYLLVNIGSGVSMIKVTGPQTFTRIGGSSLGGGTLWGLLSLLTNARSYDDMLEMAARGDNTSVDMLVGDIYGTDYPRIGLKATTIASSFGKVFKQVRNARQEYDEKKSHNASDSTIPSKSSDSTSPNVKGSSTIGTSLTSHVYDNDEEDDGYDSAGTQEEKFARFRGEDISRSLLYAISNNIGQIAYLQARNHGLEHIYFGGSYICGHPITMHTLSYAINFWSQGEKTAYFLRHEGYLGAVGAFIKRQPTGWGRRYSGTKSCEDLRALRDQMQNLDTSSNKPTASGHADDKYAQHNRPSTATGICSS